MEEKVKDIKTVLPLIFSTFFVAIASIVYELVIGGISSYLLGNSVWQFSITIGLFMTAMGVGSLLSKYITQELMTKFILIEIALGLIGGFAAVLLFTSFALSNSYKLVMYILILIIGSLTGLEIPLLTRLVRRYEDIKVVLANLMSIDYVGGLVGSILFPIILLPNLGFIMTSYLMGLLNLAVAVVIYFKYQEQFNRAKVILSLLIIAILALTYGTTQAQQTQNYLEQRLYRDKVVYSQQSKYQKIVITKDNQDLRMFLNGNIQFSSQDEYRYHESLVHPVMSLVKEHHQILVLGGGDGLVVKQLLQYPEVEKIDLVDLDRAVTTLAQHNKYLLAINDNALANKKVTIYNQDAYQFLEQSKEKYDVIISDLPDPNNESLNKLYTINFYNLAYNRLHSQGGLAVQSTSSYFAPRSFWTINQTIKNSYFNFVKPYHCYVPSFGDWGFNLALKGRKIKVGNINLKVNTKYLTEENLSTLFHFAKDVAKFKDQVQENTLIEPVLIGQYYREWENY
ncbi:polyamine aminopropyltransferase [Halanaerobacter jeridensis]|uniref:Polyamine aminopropyltransferase n=1 Tax=Halanaerobacter jeridensis TaxID=706427 RepID=A0A938XPA6_9FIRM|nr:polyamine aminopropyltransferase [Halanaerobacter jeridensis]MBM7556693.1 spermidine synthase [Halanaerobacter jeridensis]